MNNPEAMYSIHLLSNITDLNVEEGLLQSGSRRAYFNELSIFEDGVRGILEKLLERKPKKELESDLSGLLQRLLPICDTSISVQVEKALILVRQYGDKSVIAEKLYKIRNDTLLLIRMIKEADITASEDAHEESDGTEPDTQTDGESEADHSKTALNPVVFATLIKHIENFDADAALDELKKVSSVSYGDEIDKALKRISKNLTKFDFEKNEVEIKKIMSLISGDDQQDKKDVKKKILAIDDMPDILNTVKSLLKNDFIVYCVTNHLAAFKFLANNTPDLILVDIEMPEMDGFTLVKILRQMDSCKQTPVLFLTGNVSVENIKTSIESGGDDFIKKPIDYKIMIGKINHHLNKKNTDA